METEKQVYRLSRARYELLGTGREVSVKQGGKAIKLVVDLSCCPDMQKAMRNKSFRKHLRGARFCPFCQGELRLPSKEVIYKGRAANARKAHGKPEKAPVVPAISPLPSEPVCVARDAM